MSGNSVTGIVLDIPQNVLDKIKQADDAIKKLESTSKTAAQNIKKDFDTTMVSGVDAFIKKLVQAQQIMQSLQMPKIDTTGISAAVQALAQSMQYLDKSTTTGAKRLLRIADAILALNNANPDPQIFVNIAWGIQQIGNMSQTTINNVKALGVVMAQLARDIQKVQAAQNAINNDTASASQINKLYKEQAELVRQMNSIKDKGSNATADEINLLDKMRARYIEIEQKLLSIQQKKQTAASELAFTKGTNKLDTAISTTTQQGAMDYARQARSLKDLQDAYKNLKNVMSTVDPNTARWQEMNAVLTQTRQRIDDVKRNMGEFKARTVEVNGMAGQLKNTLLAVFSVSAIKGYINKLVEVRAQMELQQTALRAILQDKDEADKVFGQVQKLAMQSPFTIQQMTTFTKQLAAYRIESEKLVDTTKMLADVSAGLGVDMGRLILAYGQVKSANYLRACLGKGTKVKMFDNTFKNVEDIVVGDELIGDDEQPRHVSKLYQGEQQMYRVSYLGGEFRCNEHHILTVYDSLTMRVSDVFVLDYLKEPYRYHGVKRIDGKYKTFIMKVEKDTVDTYYGFSIDGNHRFIIEDNVVTHNTEVRQFTEAGLNIAGELAKYFSEVEGKMISVGNVMEMITKRMVRFEDVEEVFRRVTSVGGLFYDMQKKQSETLWGQLQRIKDALTIMFNEIGKDKESVIISVVKGIRDLINNWRVLAKWINATAWAFGAYKLVVVAAKIWQTDFAKSLAQTQLALIGQKKQLVENAAAANIYKKAFTGLINAGKGLATMAIPALLIWGLVELINYFMEASAKAEALNDELSRIGSESTSDLNDALANFKRLADIISDTSKTYTDHQNAVEELKRTYGEIIPMEKLSSDYIAGLKGNYDELTATIIKYYQAKEYEKKAEKVLDSDNAKDVRESLEKAFTEANENLNFGMLLPESQVKEWADKIADELSAGKIPRSLDALEKRTKEIFGKDTKVKNIDFSDALDDAEEVAEKMGNISLATADAENAQEAYSRNLKISAETIKNELDSINKKIKEQRHTLAWLEEQGGASSRLLAENPSYWDMSYEEILKAEQQKLADLQAQLNDVNAARAAMVAQDFKSEVEDETKKLTDEIAEWWNLYQAQKSLEMEGRAVSKETGKATEQWEQNAAKMEKVKESADKLAEEFGIHVPWGLLETQNTTNELNHTLDDVATAAFPKVALSAIESMQKAHEAVLVTKGGVLSFVQTLIDILPDSLKDKLPDVGKLIDENNKELAALRGELNSVERTAKSTSESVEDIYSRRAKVNVEKFGADMTEIDNILKKGADTPQEMAKNLRASAKEWRETYKAYTESTNKEDFLKIHDYTEEQLDLLEKNAKAAESLAQEIWGQEGKSKKGGRSRSSADEELKRWQNIKKAIEETSKSFEEYRKSFSKYQADNVIDEQFKKVFQDLGVEISDYFKSGTFDARGLIDALKILQGQLKATTTERQKALNDILLEIERKEIDLKVKLAEDAENKLQKDIDELFANYELTNTLEGLGLNVDLTFMVGGKPMTLDDIKKEITQLKDLEGSSGATNRIKIYEDALKKLAEMEYKSQLERLKQYGKYLSRSYSDAASLQLKYYSTITKMQQDFDNVRQNLTNIINDPLASAGDKETAQKQLDQLSEQAKRAAEGMRQEMEKELSKLNMDALFKDSMFAEMFQDLSKLSSKALDQMLKKIDEIKNGANDLTLSQVRQLSQAAEKLREAKIDTASWKELGSFIQKAYDLRRQGISPTKASDNLATSQLELDALNQQIDDLNLILGIKEQGYEIDGDILTVGGEQITLTENQRNLLKSEVSILNQVLATTKRQKEAKQEEVKKNKENVQTYDDAKKANVKLANELQKLGEAGQAAMDVITSSLELFGKEISESDQMWADFVSDMLSSIITLAVQFVALGIEINSAMGIIGIIALALTVVANLFKTILGAHDAKINEQIDDIKDHVKDLENAYDDLADAIDRAYTMAAYRANYDKSLDNIAQRINAQRQIIGLENEKKKKDEEAIRDANDEIRDLEKEREELMQQFYEDWGSIANTGIKDQAEEWVSVWLDAFKETGDGLDALMDNWDEFFENLVIKQAASAIVSSRIKKYVDLINEALESGTPGINLASILMGIKDQFKSDMEGINEDLKLFFESLGFTGGQGDLVLSDLQKGIQNITEPQAAAIEAYLNSMRFAVFEQNNILYQMLDAIKAQYTSSADNPVLNELKGIRALVSSIDDRLSKVIVSRSVGASSYVVKIS